MKTRAWKPWHQKFLSNMKITLPTSLNPISRRKDKSVKLSFETRELDSTELMTLMALEGQEMWLILSPNENDAEIPLENAELDTKSPAQRLRSVLYVLYQQDMKENKFVGLFETFYKERMEKLIELIKNKLD